MNSSNMSLKEGFDFLFEEADKSKKYEIIWNKDSVAPQNTKDCVAYILATDIVVSAIKNEDEPLILKLLRDPGISKDIDYAQGRTISFSILKNKVKSFQGFKTFYDISNDNVKNIGVFESIGQVYVQSVNQLVNSGATRMMLEAKQNVLKIDKARYLQMFRTFKTQSLIPKQKNQTKINFTRIYQSISSRIENEGLLKTSSKEGKYEKDEKYTELSDHEKAYEASVYFFKKLSTDQKRGFGGKKIIEDFLNLLSSRKETSVVDLVRQFKESWNLKSKTVAKYIEKQFDEMIDSILGADSVAAAEDFLDGFTNGFPTVDVTSVTPDELADNLKQLETSKSQEVLPSKDSADTQDIDIPVIIEAFNRLIKELREKTTKAISVADLYLKATKDKEWVSSLLTTLTSVVTKALTLNISLDDFGKSLEKSAEHINNFGTNSEKSDIQKLSDSFNGIVTEFNLGKNRISDYLKSLEGNDIEEINIDSSEINKDYTTMFNIDQAEADALKNLGVEIGDSVNKSEVKDELETFVPQGLDVSVDGDRLSSDDGPDTINREIGDTVKEPGRARSEEESGEEVEEIDASEIFQIKTELKEPRDENNFMQNFGAMISFLYERHPVMRSDIESGLVGEKTIKDLKTLLGTFSDRVNREIVMQSAESFDDTVDTKTLKLFNKSVINLSVFGEKNIDGIIFESAATQKYKIKLKKESFLIAVKAFIKDIEMNRLQADVFRNASFFSLSFPYEKINSSTGNNVATDMHQFFTTTGDEAIKVQTTSENEFTLRSDAFPEDTVVVDYNDLNTINMTLNGSDKNVVDKTEIGYPALVSLIKQTTDKEEQKTVVKDLTDNAETLRSVSSSELIEVVAGAGVDESTAKEAVEQLAKSDQDLDQKKVESVNSIQELLDDKVIKKMSDALYRDGGELINAISSTSALDFVAMKSGDEQATINFKSSLAVQLNPDIDVLKPMINDIFEGELTPVFDSLFLGIEKYNEEKFKAAYSQLILSSFDKLVDIKQGRITEGLGSLMRKAGRAIKSGLANVTAMAPILAPVATACYYALQTTVGATIFPYIMAGFGAWNIFSAIRDVKKFEEEKAKYRDNPLKYIEDSIFKDKKARKTIADIVSHLTAGVVAARINPVYQVKRQNSGAGIVAGTSDWSKKLDAQLEEYNSLSAEDKEKAKIFNDRMIEQVKQTRYAKLGVISEGVVNEIFNEVMFGSKRIGPDVRQKLFEGNIAKDEEALRQLAKSLHTAIAYSSVKNNFLKFLENRIRDASASFSKDSQRFAVELRDDQLDKNTKGRLGDVDKSEEYRKPFRAIQRNQQLFISPEQITEDFIGKLLVELTGMEQKEYNSLLAKAPTQFNENYIGGSLTRLLFEENTAEEENKADQDKLEDERREANKQSNLTMPEAAGLGGINWAGSLYQTFYVDSLVSGSKSIFKSGFKVGTKKVSSVNVTDAFCKTPFDANALNQMGFDPGHALIQGVNPYGGNVERIFFYYFDGAEGADKLSGILIKADGSCLELGHGKSLYGWFAKNAVWAKKFGVAVDAKKGIATAVGSGKSLAASSAQMKADIVSMKTHLIGSYKAQVTVAQMKTTSYMLDQEIAKVADLLDNKGHVTPDTFSNIYKSIYRVWKQQYEAGGPDAIPNEYIPSDHMQSILNTFNEKIDAIASSGEKGYDAVKTAMENLVNDPNIAEKMKAFEVAKEKWQLSFDVDFDAGMISDQTEAAEQAMEAANSALSKAITTGFEKNAAKLSVSEIKTLTKIVAQKATGATAQAGFNPILDVSVQSVKKAVSFLQKMSPIKIGDTSTLEKIATIALKSDAAVIATSKVIGPVGLLGKVCAKFFKRGIKGGTFAEQFYKVFKPQQLVYSDMLYAICGAEVPGRSKVDSVDSNGGMTSTLLNVNDQSNNNTGVQITSMPTEITSNDASNRTVEENYVYKNSLSDYLFENKIVTKNKKTSKISSASLSLNEEFEAHSHLKDLFKKLV